MFPIIESVPVRGPQPACRAIVRDLKNGATYALDVGGHRIALLDLLLRARRLELEADTVPQVRSMRTVPALVRGTR